MCKSLCIISIFIPLVYQYIYQLVDKICIIWIYRVDIDIDTVTSSEHFGTFFRSGRVIFAINVATTKSRTASYHTELDHLYNEILREVAKSGVNKIVVCTILGI